MSSYQQRPKPANIEDRDEAQATLETLLEEDSDITWVQFRYRVIRGGAGLARSEELAGTKGVDRDLSSLTLEEVGSNGIAELRGSSHRMKSHTSSTTTPRVPGAKTRSAGSNGCGMAAAGDGFLRCRTAWSSDLCASTSTSGLLWWRQTQRRSNASACWA